MANVRLTLEGLTDEHAAQVARLLSEQWAQAPVAASAYRVLVVSDEDLARERADADLLRRCRDLWRDLAP
jgi:hypothetical protein